MGVVTRDGGVRFGWECVSCGKSWPHFDGSATVAKIRNDFLYHVTTEHNQSEADFEGWS